MADPRQRVTDWLEIRKRCGFAYSYEVLDGSNNTTEVYFAPYGVQVGGQCLKIAYKYDINNNITAHKASLSIWTQDMQDRVDTI